MLNYSQIEPVLIEWFKFFTIFFNFHHQINIVVEIQFHQISFELVIDLEVDLQFWIISSESEIF